MAKGSGVTRNARSLTGAKAKQSGGEAAKRSAEPKEEVVAMGSKEAYSSYIDKQVSNLDSILGDIKSKLKSMKPDNAVEVIHNAASDLERMKKVKDSLEQMHVGAEYAQQREALASKIGSEEADALPVRARKAIYKFKKVLDDISSQAGDAYVVAQNRKQYDVSHAFHDLQDAIGKATESWWWKTDAEKKADEASKGKRKRPYMSF